MIALTNILTLSWLLAQYQAPPPLPQSVASTALVITNPPSWHTSDMLLSRTCTNGNTMTIALDVVPAAGAAGYTNAAIIQFH